MSTAPKSNRTTHTPGPWKVVSHFTGPLEIYAKDDQLIAMIGAEVFGVAVDNAEFIVRACNAHDDLVAALSYMAGVYECSCPDECVPDCAMAVARAALAKAEGK